MAKELDDGRIKVPAREAPEDLLNAFTVFVSLFDSGHNKLEMGLVDNNGPVPRKRKLRITVEELPVDESEFEDD